MVLSIQLLYRHNLSMIQSMPCKYMYRLSSKLVEMQDMRSVVAEHKPSYRHIAMTSKWQGSCLSLKCFLCNAGGCCILRQFSQIGHSGPAALLRLCVEAASFRPHRQPSICRCLPTVCRSTPSSCLSCLYLLVLLLAILGEYVAPASQVLALSTPQHKQSLREQET